MREAFHIATTGRPGPVLIDVPKDVQQAQIVPDYDAPMNLPGYHVEDRKARPEQIAQVAAAIKRSKRPVIYAGGGVIIGRRQRRAARAGAARPGIPVTMTLMGLGAFPGERPARRSTCSACTAASTPTTPSTRPTCCWPSACASTTA